MALEGLGLSQFYQTVWLESEGLRNLPHTKQLMRTEPGLSIHPCVTLEPMLSLLHPGQALAPGSLVHRILESQSFELEGTLIALNQSLLCLKKWNCHCLETSSSLSSLWEAGRDTLKHVSQLSDLTSEPRSHLLAK